jgi:methylglyoxal synthase
MAAPCSLQFPLTIALIAHDNKKNDMVALAIEFKDLLSNKNVHLIGTGTTGIQVSLQSQLFS